jgi:hypothetical protein
MQPARRVLNREEQLELGVQLRVRGGNVLVLLVFAKLPLHGLLRQPVLVLKLVERGVVGAGRRLLVGPTVVAAAAVGANTVAATHAAPGGGPRYEEHTYIFLSARHNLDEKKVY